METKIIKQVRFCEDIWGEIKDFLIPRPEKCMSCSKKKAECGGRLYYKRFDFEKRSIDDKEKTVWRHGDYRDHRVPIGPIRPLKITTIDELDRYLNAKVGEYGNWKGKLKEINKLQVCRTAGVDEIWQCHDCYYFKDFGISSAGGSVQTGIERYLIEAEKYESGSKLDKKVEEEFDLITGRKYSKGVKVPSPLFEPQKTKKMTARYDAYKKIIDQAFIDDSKGHLQTSKAVTEGLEKAFEKKRQEFIKYVKKENINRLFKEIVDTKIAKAFVAGRISYNKYQVEINKYREYNTGYEVRGDGETNYHTYHYSRPEIGIPDWLRDRE